MSAAVVTLTPTNNPGARRILAGPISEPGASSVVAAELDRLHRCGFRATMPHTSPDGAYTVVVLRHPHSSTELHLAIWRTL